MDTDTTEGVGNDDAMTKHSLYKLASPLQRTSYLQQGKLRTSDDSMSPHSHRIPSSHEHISSFKISSSPHVLPSPAHNISMDNDSTRSLEFPSGDHTLSLSLSESDDDGSSPLHSQPFSEQKIPSCTIKNSVRDFGEDKTVLVVDADTSNIRDPTQSTILEVTSVEVPSPVKVVPHFMQKDDQWRRFSTNFMDSLPSSSTLTGKTFTKHNSNKVLAASSKVASSPSDEVNQTRPLDVEEMERARKDPQVTTKNEDEIEEDSREGKPPEKSFSKSTDVHEKSLVKRKNKGRVIASRYMSQAVDTKKQPPVSKLHSNVSSRSVTSSSTRKRAPKSTLPAKSNSKFIGKTVEGGFKVPTINPRVKNASSAASRVPHSSQPSTSLHEDLFQTPILNYQGMTTSTPYQNALPVHDGSFLADFVGPPSVIRGPSTKMKNQPAIGNRVVDDLEMELLYNRLIQATYLDVVSAKALKLQEAEAKAQIYGLWKTVEDKKKEVSQLSMKLEEEERKWAVDKALDVQLKGLGSVCTRLPLMERHYREMAKALDVTRHNMMLEGVKLVSEEEIESELAEVEAMLGEISTAVREKIPKVCNFSSTSEAIVGLLDREYEELDGCLEELSKVTRTQTKETSLHFEKLYRIPTCV